jgi:hypothetical protein
MCVCVGDLTTQRRWSGKNKKLPLLDVQHSDRDVADIFLVPPRQTHVLRCHDTKTDAIRTRAPTAGRANVQCQHVDAVARRDSRANSAIKSNQAMQ